MNMMFFMVIVRRIKHLFNGDASTKPMLRSSLYPCNFGCSSGLAISVFYFIYLFIIPIFQGFYSSSVTTNQLFSCLYFYINVSINFFNPHSPCELCRCVRVSAFPRRWLLNIIHTQSKQGIPETVCWWPWFLSGVLWWIQLLRTVLASQRKVLVIH